MDRFEALVLGGGPAGATAALLLARAGFSVALLEKAPFPRRKVCGEFVAGSAVALLHELGLGERFEAACGPAIRRIAVWAGDRAFEAPMPRLRRSTPQPRGLEREALDTLLLEAAARCGAAVFQPAMALGLVRTADGFVCRSAQRRGAPPMELGARIVIAAHGSWQPGALATQPPRLRASPYDLLAFKAHYRGADLPAGAVVLLPFPGGYAGLLDRGAGRATLAACVRRDAFTAAGGSAAALFDSMREASPRLARALDDATLPDAWLAAGPLRPGRRPLYRDGILVVGNAAGEAHPVVGEGIAMAMHSAALAAHALAAHRDPADAAREYAQHWRRRFALRLWASARYAALAMHPRAAGFGASVLGRAPRLLTAAALISGKT
jgi:flavin-dependent dehydrogenase